METRSIEEARGKLGNLLPPHSSEPTCLTRNGVPVGVVLPMAWFYSGDDDEMLRRIAEIRRALFQNV